MGRMKRVQKTRPVTKTRLVPGSDGSYATEVYTEQETYWDTEYVTGPDSYGSDFGGSSYE
jgi:hypothetical protein